MGLSPEVVTRALAAARAAGIGARPRGAQAPATHFHQPTRPAPNLAPSPAQQVQRDATITPGFGHHPQGPQGNAFNHNHGHAHLIEGDAARQLALDSQRWRLPNPNDMQHGGGDTVRPNQHGDVRGGRARPPSPTARPDTWRRLQNVGTFLGLRQENGTGAAQTPPTQSPASRLWPTEPRSSGPNPAQQPPNETHLQEQAFDSGEGSRRGSSPTTTTAITAGGGGDSRRGSGNAVRGLGFNLTEDRNGRTTDM